MVRTDIHEIFASFQGEGIRVGEPMIFVRFAQCDLACRFCDTPPPEKPLSMSLEEVYAQVEKLNARSGPYRFVVLTGGEPLRYADFLEKFLPTLRKKGFQTYLESDGTKPAELGRVAQWTDLVAMDIKLPSATGLRPFWAEHERYLEAARGLELFVKAVVAGSTPPAEIVQAARLVARFDSSIPFIIQPAARFGSFNDVPEADHLTAFVRAARAHLEDVRVIGQTHKLLGVR